VLLLFAALVGWLQHRTEVAEKAAEHADHVIALSRTLQNDLTLAGVDGRVFLLTGSPAAYAAAFAKLGVLPSDVARLRQSVADSPAQSARAAAIGQETLAGGAQLRTLLQSMHSGDRRKVFEAQIAAELHNPKAGAKDDRFREDIAAFEAAEIAQREQAEAAADQLWSRWGLILIGGTVASVLLTLVLTFTFGRRIVRRMNRLSAQAYAFARRGVVVGALADNDEIGALSRTLHDMAVQVKERNDLLVRYRMLAENANDSMIFVRRRDNRIIEANRITLARYGYTMDELLTMTPYDLRVPREVGVPGKHMPEFGDFNMTFETVHRRKDGTEFPVEIAVQSAVIDGEGVTLGVARDLSERKAAERAINDALEKAVEASRLKSEFVATMSHEIRTPMNGVIGATELLLSTSLDAQQREFALTARDSAHSLLGVITNILDFSKIEAGKIELDTTEFDLVAYVEGVGSMLGVQAYAKGVSLMTYVDPSIPARVIGDPTHLRQVLVNLVGNAIKFTEKGGVALTADLMSRSDDSVQVAFAIRDTGIGIDPDALSKVFGAFTQADGSTTRKYGGTGLGLAITKRLVELMGGEIGVESYRGAGSTFSFELMFRTTNGATERPVRDELHAMRALVVDDDVMSRDILSRYLGSWGLRVGTAATAQEGLDALRVAASFEEPFDLALLDMRMPDIGGLELGRTILNDASLNRAKLILITAFDTLDQGREAIGSGFAAYLTKPIRQSYLYDAIVEARYGEQTMTFAAPEDRATREGAILLVEDNEINRRIMLKQLENLGFHAECVTNGREALERTANEAFDVILMDCQMPLMDGFEATRAIRKREGRTGAHVPIVAMTANALTGDRDACFSAGMDDYISKPIAMNELEAALARWLDRPQRKDILDVERLRAILGDDRVATRDFLISVLPNMTQLCSRIEAERDRGALRELAHELKGASGNVGARELATAAQALESVLKNGTAENPRAIENVVEQILEACTRFSVAVREVD
jgi:PAS domain S-box-containing protein